MMIRAGHPYESSPLRRLRRFISASLGFGGNERLTQENVEYVYNNTVTARVTQDTIEAAVAFTPVERVTQVSLEFIPTVLPTGNPIVFELQTPSVLLDEGRTAMIQR